jgi:hypothetical protein
VAAAGASDASSQAAAAAAAAPAAAPAPAAPAAAAAGGQVPDVTLSEVPVEYAESLSYAAFVERYMAPNRPVLIKVCVLEGHRGIVGADWCDFVCSCAPADIASLF